MPNIRFDGRRNPAVTREDDVLKAEATRPMAQYSRTVSENTRAFADARREWAELERITTEASRRTDLNKRILEERLCIIEEIGRAALDKSHVTLTATLSHPRHL